MRIFYQRNKKTENIEEKIEKKTKIFLDKLRKKGFIDFIEVFGLTGPSARGQATIYGGDIDFYFISKAINPIKEGKIRKLFEEIVRVKGIETSLLSASPTIYKRPDLMFYEFIHSNGFVYGKPRISKRDLPIKRIPRWEGVRLLTYRINPFINSFRIRKDIEITTNKPDYYYSKIVQGIGEAFLILTNKYSADNFKRLNAMKKNRYAKKLGIIEDIEKSYDYRYKGKRISNK